MTAEVCVMNRLGIALAADSAVTLSSSGEKKIYTSVDKLFNLSNFEPVGIMVYGNASYLELMWETVVKEYRRQLGAQRFDSLREHADDFLEFLENEEVFPENIKQRQIMNRTSESRKFRSGAEIMETFVPGFQREPLSLEEQGDELVKRLLEEFDKALKADPRVAKEEAESVKSSQKKAG